MRKVIAPYVKAGRQIVKRLEQKEAEQIKQQQTAKLQEETQYKATATKIASQFLPAELVKFAVLDSGRAYSNNGAGFTLNLPDCYPIHFAVRFNPAALYDDAFRIKMGEPYIWRDYGQIELLHDDAVAGFSSNDLNYTIAVAYERRQKEIRLREVIAAELEVVAVELEARTEDEAKARAWYEANKPPEQPAAAEDLLTAALKEYITNRIEEILDEREGQY